MTGFIVSLFLPWAMGVAWLSRFWRSQSLAALLGYGYLLGVVATTLFIRLWDRVGFQQDFWVMAISLAAIAIIPLALKRQPPTLKELLDSPRSPGDPGQPLHWKNVIFVIFFALAAYRLTVISYDNLLRPLFPWDAWRSYAPMAKIWFELKELAPFVPSRQWLKSEALDAAYPIMLSSKKPVTGSLIMLWSALGLDSWRDDLVKFPWVLCGTALALGVYGQFRALRIPRHLAILFVYFLVSLPYVDIHLILAGYGEIWVATSLCFSFLAFLRWRETGMPSDLVLALLFAVSCPLFKQPGLILGALMILAILVDKLPLKALWALGAAAGVVVVAAWIAGGIDAAIPGGPALQIAPGKLNLPYLNEYSLGFTDVSGPIFDSLLSSANWHLLWHGMFLLVILGLLGQGKRRILVGPAFLVVTAVAFFLFVFFFVPDYADSAFEKTTLNRALLLLTPTLLVFFVWWFFSTDAPARGAAPRQARKETPPFTG